MAELVDNVALAFKMCNQQRERIAELEHQLAEEKKDFDALDDQYHRLGEKYEEIQKIAPQSNKENSMPVGKPMDICPSCRAWIFLGAHHAEGCTRFQSKRTLENERQLAIADARALTLNADFGKMNDLLGSLEWVRARIEANPKTLEERIANLLCESLGHASGICNVPKLSSQIAELAKEQK